MNNCSVDCCARLRHRLQSRRCSVRVDHCWDRTGHGCPTLCYRKVGVSEVQQCCTGACVPL